MASRYGESSYLHPRGNGGDQPSDRYGSDRYTSTSPSPSPAPSFGAYPSTSSSAGTFRAATPNRKGQYSASVLEELESQNDLQVEGLSAKVRMLRDITVAIGDEVRSSTSLMGAMNERFEGTREKLAGTMRNMMGMARRSGVGWRAWMAFAVAVVVLFWWVWL